ncbi:MAG: hypothetical protein MUO82_07890 [Candidatus Thermoplasmatota archaeon]|nr:hypothetical protein [Candidatus Thermoplasmatota archaeon]
MESNKTFKLNKVSISILIILLIFSASTLTPLVNSNAAKSYLRDQKISFYDSSEYRAFVTKLQNEIFNKEYNSKIDLIKDFIYQTSKIHNEVCDILSGKKDINNISPEIENLLTVFDNNFDIERSNTMFNSNPYQDWGNYSGIYNETLACWQLNASYWEEVDPPAWPFINVLENLKLFTHKVDNYRDWYLDYHDSIDSYKTLSAGLIVLGTMMLFFASPTIGANDFGLIFSTLGALVVLGVLWFDLSLLVYFSSTYELFSMLLTMEINIYIHITDNKTHLGINDLNIYDENRGIFATNNNARANCEPGKPGWEDEDFTYYLQPVDDICIDGDSDGWYCLSSRLHPREWYDHAPCPPGNWIIKIKLPTSSPYQEKPDISIPTISRGCTIFLNETLIPKK